MNSIVSYKYDVPYNEGTTFFQKRFVIAEQADKAFDEFRVVLLVQLSVCVIYNARIHD